MRNNFVFKQNKFQVLFLQYIHTILWALVVICCHACMFFLGCVSIVQEHFFQLKQNVFTVGYELRLEVQISTYNLNISTYMYSHILYSCHSSSIDAFQMKLSHCNCLLGSYIHKIQANIW